MWGEGIGGHRGGDIHTQLESFEPDPSSFIFERERIKVSFLPVWGCLCLFNYDVLENLTTRVWPAKGSHSTQTIRMPCGDRGIYQVLWSSREEQFFLMNGSERRKQSGCLRASFDSSCMNSLGKIT